MTGLFVPVLFIQTFCNGLKPIITYLNLLSKYPVTELKS
jgi:hypothetical protein